jgi:hypothetical protein
MGGYVHSKLSKCFIITPKPLLLSEDPKFSNPPYLINGDSVGKFYCTIGLTTFINGGVGHIKTPKKKPNFGGNTHVTLNPKHGHHCVFLVVKGPQASGIVSVMPGSYV